LLKMFPNKNWSLDGLKVLIKITDNTGTVVRRIGQWSTSHCLHSTFVVNFFALSLTTKFDGVIVNEVIHG